ncbi:hypothetical protein J4Q44_G00238090 [Coregonus suidteri]|uniref:Uncharacterized protein n=1 Tax=Coregonus suidteri TaxID=861788 RepID=A0AAN8QGL4_9TELE
MTVNHPRSGAPCKISPRGINDHEEAFLEFSEEVATLKQEIIPLSKKLEPYRDLSPSPSLAEVKIEEAKQEFAAIDAQLEMKVDFINSSISRTLKKQACNTRSKVSSCPGPPF